MILTRKISLLASILFLAACSSPKTIYNWGNGEYNDSLYAYLTQEGDPQEQLNKLETLAQQSNANKKVAPGLYAQIGLLYNQLGNQAKATEAFNKETELFPESKQYIQFLLNKGNSASSDNVPKKSANVTKKGGKK